MSRGLRLSTMLVAVLIATLGFGSLAAAKGRCGNPSSRPWCDTSLTPDERAGLLVAAMTQNEKVSLLGGEDPLGVLGREHTHTGTGAGIPRLGLPSVYYSDGPVGPRQGMATAMPVPMALAATFSPALASEHGATIANEARSKGNDVVYAPTVNVMRTPLGGRTFEAYGEDPWLVSRLAVGWIEGAQGQGVIANVKHFAANNQEGADPTGLTANATVKLPFGAGIDGGRMVVNAVIDERTLREIYLPQFEAAVKEAHVGTVMCSYNRLNGQYACENNHLLEQILRKEWGFKGYVLADYLAAHNTIASFNNGLDFEPFPPIAYQPLLVDAVLATTLGSTDTLDDHIRTMMRTLFAYGFFDRDAYADSDAQIDKPAHAAVAQRIEEAAVTLLRNDGMLPLDSSKLKSIAVIGKAATRFVTGGGSGNVVPWSYTTPLAAIGARAGSGVKVTYNDGSDAASAVAAAQAADVAIVFGGDYDAEGADQSCLTLECPDQGDQDGVIAKVSAAKKHTVVVLMTGGPVLTPWRSRVGALLEAWYPGIRGGAAIANVLFGDVDPSGRLPATFPASYSQEPTAGDRLKYPGDGLNVFYKEGVLVGYRWFDQFRLKPAFEFGFGLSYTTFRMRKLKLVRGRHGNVARATIEVTNTGARKGIAVPQLYLGLPTPPNGAVQPPWQLKGVTRVTLAPGQTKRVGFNLAKRAFQYWNTAGNEWRTAPGCYAVGIGSSSRELPLRGTIARSSKACGKRALKLK